MRPDRGELEPKAEQQANGTNAPIADQAPHHPRVTAPILGEDDVAALVDAFTQDTAKDITQLHTPLPEVSENELDDLTVCPRCKTQRRHGELACSNCGFLFNAAGKTRKVENQEPINSRSWPTGDVVAIEQKPITFEIENRVHTFLVRESVIVGRGSDVAGDTQPDVDLNPFGAGDKGVSRRHLQLKRKGTMLYVIDLNSTNGTMLNGRKLIAEGERLLRSGDDLWLGHLKLRIKF
jgi:rubredoxin